MTEPKTSFNKIKNKVANLISKKDHGEPDYEDYDEEDFWCLNHEKSMSVSQLPNKLSSFNRLMLIIII